LQLEIDRMLLPAVLQFTNNNQYKAAKILGLARQTLRLRLRNIGFSVVKTLEMNFIEGYCDRKIKVYNLKRREARPVKRLALIGSTLRAPRPR